jgi:hypothetical protein
MDNDSWWLPTHGRSSEWSAAPVETMLREYRVSVTVRGGWSVAGQSVATRLQLPAPACECLRRLEGDEVRGLALDVDVLQERC